MFFTFWAFPSFAQFYLRGEIKDDKNQPVKNARIYVHSEKKFIFSDPTGSFGIVSKLAVDSIYISLDGYEPLGLKVKTSQWQHLIMKSTAEASSKYHPKLISYTKDYNQSASSQTFSGEETYFQLIENDFIQTKEFPSTGYSLNVNKASYSNVRRFINQQEEVPVDAVRIEELVNYFDLGYREPKKDSFFSFNSQITNCPWKEKDRLLYLQVCAKKLDLEKVPPGNFVFLMDVSGSMDMPNRLPLIKAAFGLFVKNLRPTDTVTIITYGGYVMQWLAPTSGAEKEKILKSIEELEAQGDTPGESAIKMAYRAARKSFIKGGNNRIILATDGDFNVGETSEKALDDLITNERNSGVYLTCLGVGMGNLKDSKLQTLAKKGNGNYAYLDDIREAERVLVKELTQTFYTVADDVFMNVKFNPATVLSYRLIGFDNKKDALSDSANAIEGGEIGSGSSVLAVFQLTPNDSSSNRNGEGLIANLELKYSLNNDSIIKKYQYRAVDNFVPLEKLPNELRFATAVTIFGLKLKNSKYYNDQSWATIAHLAKSSADPGNYLQNEFVTLIAKAQKIYKKSKKKKRSED